MHRPCMVCTEMFDAETALVARDDGDYCHKCNRKVSCEAWQEAIILGLSQHDDFPEDLLDDLCKVVVNYYKD